MSNSAFLTDKDVMAVLRISRKTLSSAMKHGKKVCGVNLRDAQPIIVGAGKKCGQRRWSISKFAAATGLTKDEILAAIA